MLRYQEQQQQRDEGSNRNTDAQADTRERGRDRGAAPGAGSVYPTGFVGTLCAHHVLKLRFKSCSCNLS
jgi:hypothetical protein